MALKCRDGRDTLPIYKGRGVMNKEGCSGGGGSSSMLGGGGGGEDGSRVRVRGEA